MPPKTAQQPNFLLKITLVKIANPTVTRLISVPADLQFNELHLTIAAAFDWDDPCYSWLFRIWTEDPVKYCDSHKHKGNIAIYCISDDSDASTKPSELKAQSTLSQQLKGAGTGKFWTYDYDISRFYHAIEVVDTLKDDQKGTIGCLGGQGQVSRKTWQFADLAGVDGVIIGAKSTWDLDMGQLNARLSLVQKAYEERKTNEANKQSAKKRPAAKSKTSASGPAKVIPGKSKAAIPAKKTRQSVHKVPTTVRGTVKPPAKTTPAKIIPITSTGATAKSNPLPTATPAKPKPPPAAKLPPTQAANCTTAAHPALPTTSSAPPPARTRATHSSTSASSPPPKPTTARPNPPPTQPTRTTLLRTIAFTPPPPIFSPLTPPPPTIAQSRKRALPTLTASNEQAKKSSKVVKTETSVKEETLVKKEGKHGVGDGDEAERRLLLRTFKGR